MTLRNKYSFVLLLVSVSFCAFGQNDTLTTLSLNQFLQLVKQNNPIAKQADLITKSADANTLIARGAFDPKLFYDFRNKFYDSKSYYTLANGGFNIPTWYGVELKGGYEQNEGPYVNPENTVPDQGLLYAQISFPLLQGLIIDERRATLKKAKLFRELSEFDKINAINDLLYNAGKTYWDWYLSYTNLQVHQDAVALSQERFEAIRTSFTLGDRPAIDTVEANIQLQDRIINVQQALMDYRTKSLLLSNYLWLENETPIELTDQTIPEVTLENDENEALLSINVSRMDSLINVHPDLKIYDYKLQQLSIEERYIKDKLKPSLNLLYSPLYNPEQFNAGFQNNYKWGVSVAFPILLRKERGQLQMTRIEIENTSYENKNKRIELLNKTKATINEFNGYTDQIEIYSKNVVNYERLWQSEQRLFDSGEGSLFMINSREMSYINARIKLNEIINKTKKSALEAEYAFGLLHTMY